MSSEQEELLDEVYEKYADSHEYFVDGWLHVIPMEHYKETFINKCKTDKEFSERWGLKIEERELSREERITIYVNQYMEGIGKPAGFEDAKLSTRNIPKKVTTISYNDKTIESYE
jgi:hypothetical protein